MARQTPATQTSIIRPSSLRGAVGLSRWTILRLEKEGKFPRRIQLSARAVGWRSDEVQVWMDARARGELDAQPKLGARK